MENSRSIAIYSISRNYVSLQFYVVKSHLCPIWILSAISCEITLKSTSISLKIPENKQTCHSQISLFPQIVKYELRFTLNSRKFWSLPITNITSANDLPIVSQCRFVLVRSIWDFPQFPRKIPRLFVEVGHQYQGAHVINICPIKAEEPECKQK